MKKVIPLLMSLTLLVMLFVYPASAESIVDASANPEIHTVDMSNYTEAEWKALLAEKISNSQ